MTIRKRLQNIEARMSPAQPPARSEARERMREHLDRIATLRRSDDPEDQAELAVVREDVERRLKLVRGEGGS